MTLARIVALFVEHRDQHPGPGNGRQLGALRLPGPFRVGESTGPGLPAEAPGPAATRQPAACHHLLSTAIGYRVGVYPAPDGGGVRHHRQQRGVGAAAHRQGGHPPRRARGSRRADPPRRGVRRAETARTMLSFCRGWWRPARTRARRRRVHRRGKTGTTEKWYPRAGQYLVTDRIASFIGIAPVNDPQVVIAVALRLPRRADASATSPTRRAAAGPPDGGVSATVPSPGRRGGSAPPEYPRRGVDPVVLPRRPRSPPCTQHVHRTGDAAVTELHADSRSVTPGSGCLWRCTGRGWMGTTVRRRRRRGGSGGGGGAPGPRRGAPAGGRGHQEQYVLATSRGHGRRIAGGP